MNTRLTKPKQLALLSVAVGFTLLSGMKASEPSTAPHLQPSAPAALAPLRPSESNAQTPVPITLGHARTLHGGVHVRDLGPVAENDLLRADQDSAKRFANSIPAPPRVGLVRAIKHATTWLKYAPGPGGARANLQAIRSPGAFGLRLHFTNFNANAGSVLVYALSEDGAVVRGPYSGKGPDAKGRFWTESLPGDTAFVEVSGSAEPEVRVDAVVHFDRLLANSHVGRFALAQLPCHVDVMCVDPSQVDAAARDAVGQVNFVSAGVSYVCSGTLLNDRDYTTSMPYFLTAFHCINTQAEADSMEVVYLWQRSGCGGALPNYFKLPRSRGGTLLASNPTTPGNDMSFIVLNGALPEGVGLAGWATCGFPPSAVGIHHPAGDWKRATILHEHKIADCQDTPTSMYYFLEQDDGVVEGGSSGSGVFNSSGQLMGQLCGECPDGGCTDRDKYNALYGKFSVTYPLIERFLEIGGTIYVDRNYSGPEKGTVTQPYNTVTEASDAAWNGIRVKVRAGTYLENITFSKSLTILAEGGTVTIGN